jgi:ligand-binding sensor domain-containing protein
VTINFDSTSFPIEEEIRGIYEDQQHQIWVQTKVAVYRYTNNHWTRFDHKVLGLKKEPLLFDAIFREDEQGNLLLLTKQGLIKWDGQQWSTELLWKGAIKKAKPTKFWLDGDTIWIAGLHQGVYTINRKNPKQVTIISSTLSIEDWSKEEKTAVVWLLLSYGEGVCKYVP